MRVRGLCCGWLGMELGGLLEGSTGRVRVPVPGYLIEHNGSVAVFDAGLHPAMRDDQRVRLGAMADYFDCQLPPGSRLDERLEECEVDPAGVELLVLSHLHFDHAGGSALLRGARLLLQRAEWEAALAADDGINYTSDDFDCGHERQLLDGEHDLFGDGRAVLVPTPGHTAGHQSLRIRTDKGEELVLCADACYMRRALEERLLPPFAFDRQAQLEAMDVLAGLEAGGARLVFGHDPTQWPEDGAVVELSA